MESLLSHRSPRLAVRAVLVEADRLLLVNAWPGDRSDLWCAPGGGVEIGQSLPDNLAREVHEETGLSVSVGVPCLVNEFHDPGRGFHQIEVFFRCSLDAGQLDAAWADPEGVVTRRRWFSRDELSTIRLRPGSLREIPWTGGVAYDPLEHIVR